MVCQVGKFSVDLKLYWSHFIFKKKKDAIPKDILKQQKASCSFIIRKYLRIPLSSLTLYGFCRLARWGVQCFSIVFVSLLDSHKLKQSLTGLGSYFKGLELVSRWLLKWYFLWNVGNFSPRKFCLDFKQIAIASSILFGPVIFLCHDLEIWYIVMCICAHKLLQKTNRKGF